MEESSAAQGPREEPHLADVHGEDETLQSHELPSAHTTLVHAANKASVQFLETPTPLKTVREEVPGAFEGRPSTAEGWAQVRAWLFHASVPCCALSFLLAAQRSRPTSPLLLPLGLTQTQLITAWGSLPAWGKLSMQHTPRPATDRAPTHRTPLIITPRVTGSRYGRSRPRACQGPRAHGTPHNRGCAQGAGEAPGPTKGPAPLLPGNLKAG